MSGPHSLYRIIRSLTSAEGRSVAWTRLRHAAILQQTATTTAPDRYPELFDQIARLLPPDARILSFGCSSGEELVALRQRLRQASIVGVEVNRRARAAATRRVADDGRIQVVEQLPKESFDAILALAVLQREPHRVADERIVDLSHHYPFARFDAAVAALVGRLRPGGLLAVTHAHYRVEDSAAAPLLTAVPGSPMFAPPLFDGNSRLYNPAPAAACLFTRAVER